MRISVLGGEVPRRGFFGPLNRIEVATLGGVFAVSALLWLSVDGVFGVVAGFAVLGGAVAVVLPSRGRRSLAEGRLWRLRFLLRRHRGLDRFVPPCLIPAGQRPGPPVPPPLGGVVPLALGDTPERDIFVLHHHNPGEPAYLSVLLQADGQAPGLRSEQEHENSAIRYGTMLSRLAAESSFIQGIQQIHRVAPYDSARHRAFIAANAPLRNLLAAEYRNLVDLAGSAQEHRDYLVAKIPMTPEFLAQARSRGEGVTGWARLVREELVRLAGFADQSGLFRLRALGEQRTCAVLRSLQDPDFPLDQHDGVRWGNCWQSYLGTSSYVIVNGKWLSRTALVPPSAVAPLPLGPHWLVPLLAEVDPPVIRTLSVRIDLLPAAAARARAEQDVAMDRSAARGAAKVSDGKEILSTAERRARDLTPGSGHHGVNWSMAVSVTAPDPVELRRACGRIAAAAASCGLNRLDWQDRWHDVAAIATYPLARG